MSDYADDAVVITPHGVAPGQKDVSGADVFAGKTNYRKLFATLTDKDHVPATGRCRPAMKPSAPTPP